MNYPLHLNRKKLFLMTVIVSALLFGGNAYAQEGVITLDDTVIKGRIQKPEAFYLLQNANLTYEPLETDPSFLEEMKETVKKDPF